MDGLSSAASGIAVVSLAIQLGAGFIKLYDFWGTVREAPHEVTGIMLDLKFLTRTLDQLIERKDPNPHIQELLEHCAAKVDVLLSIVREFEPKFISNERHIRVWNAFKAARKDKKLKRFRDSLQETKTTLLLAVIPQSQQPPAYVDEIQLQDQYTTEDVKGFSASESKPSPRTFTVSDEELPRYTEIVDLPPNLTDEPVPPIHTYPNNPHQLPTGLPVPELQASIEGAFKVAAESYFHGGAFARAMNDTIHRVATIQTTYNCSQNGDEGESGNAVPTLASYHTSTTDLDLIRRPSIGGRRESQSRICHQTSATGALFGTIWLRKTSVRIDKRSGKKFDVVSSFTFFPSWWLTKLGVKFGMEATLCETFTGWQFNFNPVRAVPDDSPIFRACKTGNLPAVQFLITDGSASVKDTNSEGWTPLHFAAAAESTNVDLCEFLISEGADKGALVYKGPSEDALSPVTIFAATSKKKSADRKIEMLRLFEDCIDLSEPNSEGWTVLADLVRSFNQENVPQTSNSVTWFLRSLRPDSMVAFGPKTMWHGLQHAVRALVDLEQKNMIVEGLLGLKKNRGDRQPTKSHGMSIAYWIVLRATGKQLLLMLIAAGGIIHIEGYDFDPDTEVDPAILAKQLPFLYSEWSKALTNSIETVKEVMTTELDAALAEAGWTRESLHDLISDASKSGGGTEFKKQIRCSDCYEDYSSLGMGLVEPRWVAFIDCTASKHRFNCACPDFLLNQRVSKAGEQLENFHYDSDEEDEMFYDAESDLLAKNDQGSDASDAAWISECEKLAKSTERRKKNDPFWAIVALLYRAQARVWLGTYEADHLLCGTCFLKREGYIDKATNKEEDFFASMPTSFRS